MAKRPPTAFRVQKYLGGLRYPAAKPQILERARERGADEETLRAIGGLRDPGSDGFFDAVLDRWLVDQRQHFFRLCLRSREETGAEAGGGEDGLTNLHAHSNRICEALLERCHTYA